MATADDPECTAIERELACGSVESSQWPAEMAAHIERCSSCTRALEIHMAFWSALRQLQAVSAPPGARSTVLAGAEAWGRGAALTAFHVPRFLASAPYAT